MLQFVLNVASYMAWGVFPAIVIFIPFAGLAYLKGKKELKLPKPRPQFLTKIIFALLLLYPFVVAIFATYYGQYNPIAWQTMALVWLSLALLTVGEIVEEKTYRYTYFAISSYLLIYNAFVWAYALQG